MRALRATGRGMDSGQFGAEPVEVGVIDDPVFGAVHEGAIAIEVFTSHSIARPGEWAEARVSGQAAIALCVL